MFNLNKEGFQHFKEGIDNKQMILTHKEDFQHFKESIGKKQAIKYIPNISLLFLVIFIKTSNKICSLEIKIK